MKESTFQKKIITFAKGLAGSSIKCVKLEPSNICGMPDLLLLYNGNSLFIEVKADKGIISPRQRVFGKWLDDNNFYVHCLRPKDDYKEAVINFLMVSNFKSEMMSQSFTNLIDHAVEEKKEEVVH